MEIARLLLSLPNDSNKPNTYFDILPSHIISLIYEYDGASYARSIYQNTVLSQIQKVLTSERHYMQARISACRMYKVSKLLKPNKFLDLGPISKYMLGFNKVGCFCPCDEPCCFQFNYELERPYICNCHQDKNKLQRLMFLPGQITFRFEKQHHWVVMKVNRHGFCIKIEKKIEKKYFKF